MLSLDHMLPLNNTSNKLKCSVLVRQGKKYLFFKVIIMNFFLIRIVSNAPKSFYFRLCLFFSQQSFCFLSLQHQRIQSCEADTIPKPAIRNVQLFLLRTHVWFRT